MVAAITVIGLGSGDEQQLSLGAFNLLESGNPVFLRTEKHPVVRFLRERGMQLKSFDTVYESSESFPEVYRIIADTLVDKASQAGEEIIYAVPGHPNVAEDSVKLLKQLCRERNIPLRILGGESFLDQVFLRFGFDPIEGFQLLDAMNLNESDINPSQHIVIAQVYDQLVASDVKLTLMEVFPDEHIVFVGHALGVEGQEKIASLPLYELDRIRDFGNLSIVWIPRSEPQFRSGKPFERLKEIMTILRSPNGCPWDRAQTHTSIRKNLIEETYEVLETIDDGDLDAMCEELGDLLLQVMLHAEMEAEEGTFDIDDVVEGLTEKLIRRHPHVFGDREAENSDEALENWQKVKAEEKRQKGIDVEKQSVLSGVPRDLPGLMKAWKLQKKAARVGFDWDKVDDVMAKIREELSELEEVLPHAEVSNRVERQKEELGDLLFAVVNLARFLDIDPEEAIVRTNRKFMERFSYIERQLRLNGKKLDNTSLQEMEQLWQEAKKLLKSED